MRLTTSIRVIRFATLEGLKRLAKEIEEKKEQEKEYGDASTKIQIKWHYKKVIASSCIL